METVNILLVDDRPVNLTALVALLDDLGQNLVTAASGEAALAQVEEQDFAVILLDVDLGAGLDGFATARRMRELERSSETPIIFLTALDESKELVAHGYAIGAVDFLIKPIVPEILKAKVRVFVELCRKSLLLKIQLDQIGRLHSAVNNQKRSTDEQRRLLEQSQAARKEAEASQRRLSFLAEASALLSTSLDYETTLSTISRLCLPTIADACVINLVDEYGTLQNLSTTHIDPEKETIARKLLKDAVPDPDQPDMSKEVLRTRQPVLIPEVSDALLQQMARDADQLALLRSFTIKSAMFVPMPARGQILGVLSLYITEKDRQFNAKDLELAEEVALRAAVAVDNAQLYSELQEAIEARDEFLSVAAHELKTPITSLRGFAQMLLHRLDKGMAIDNGALRTSLEHISIQSEKLGRLVVQLLNISRIQAGQLTLDRQQTDMIKLTQDIISNYQTNVNSHHFQLRSPDQFVGFVDSLRIEQVIINLIDNAVKYSPEATSIEVEISLPDADTFSIAVTDQGPGIAPEHRADLFAPFYRAGISHSNGMGLGLYVSRQIAELHGGQLIAEFPPEGGTRFVMMLPRHNHASG